MRGPADAVVEGIWEGGSFRFVVRSGKWDQGSFKALVRDRADELRRSFLYRQGGSYVHIANHFTTKASSYFAGQYHEPQKGCPLIASCLWRPNLIVKRGSKYILVAAFNHSIGWDKVRRQGNSIELVEDPFLFLVFDSRYDDLKTAFPIRAVRSL